MKHTVLCLFSVCTLLMPTPPVMAQNEIFRQNEFPTLDSLLRHENYVDGARLAEGHRNRVAKALAQSPLKPDTLPETQVIEAFNRWTQKGRAPLRSTACVWSASRIRARSPSTLNCTTRG